MKPVLLNKSLKKQEALRDLQSKAGQAIEVLITRSHLVLLQARSIFPLDLWPDTLQLDMSKVVIFSRRSFGLTTEHTIMLDEIRDIDLEITPFFATLRILVSDPSGMWTSISNLRKHDAFRAKYILEGLLIARSEKCNLEGMTQDELIHKLCLLGGGPMSATECA